MPEKKESAFRVILVLVLISALSAVLLAWVNRVTSGPIAENKLAETRKAIAIVLSAQPELQFGTKAVETLVDGSPVHYYPALDADKKIAAVAVVVFAPNGFTNDFEIMVGIDSSLHVLDTYVLDHKETPGLGDGMKDESFKAQFRGKGMDNFQWQVKKDGGDIDALTAATITSRAFTNGVERALKTAGQVWEKQQ